MNAATLIGIAVAWFLAGIAACAMAYGLLGGC